MLQRNSNIKNKTISVSKQNKGNTYAYIKKIGNKVFLYSFLILWAIISIYPLVFSLISSFKTDQAIFMTPFSWPESISFENYYRAWEVANMGTYFKNSVFLTFTTCIVLIFICTMASYIFAKFKFKFKNVIYIFFVLGMMIPIHSTIIPLAYMVGKFGLKDNYVFIIALFTAFQIPISIIIITSFMKSIPEELEEAAIIDGCNFWQVYTKVILPLSTPAIVTVTILNFLSVWNNLIIPLLFIGKNELKPLSIGLLTFFAERTSDYSGVMAAIVITTVIPLIMYIILQEKVERGLTAGAVKG